MHWVDAENISYWILEVFGFHVFYRNFPQGTAKLENSEVGTGRKCWFISEQVEDADCF